MIIQQTYKYSPYIVASALLVALGVAIIHKSFHKRPLHHEPAIIFDLDGVLFETSKMGAFKKLGGLEVLSYAMSGNNPNGLQGIAFDILYRLRNEKPEQYEHQRWPTYRGKPLPTIMCEWQQGFKSHTEIFDEVLPFIEQLDKENYFANKKEKTIIIRLINLMFNPEIRLSITKPIREGVSLLKRYKKAGYKIYALSNLDTQTKLLLQKQYPDIFEHFDGAVYSSDVRQIKPYQGIYSHLLNKYDLDPQACLFLDNQQENLDTAAELGISCQLCTLKSMRNLNKKLVKKFKYC